MDSISVIPDTEFAKRKLEEIKLLLGEGGGYYPNTVNSHVVGRTGEDGAYAWLKQKGYKPFPNYQVTNQGCDIMLQYPTRIRLEVKTWREELFEWGGRAIAEKQMPFVRKKADRILWCSVKLLENTVYIKGWSYVSDFDSAPLVTKGKLDLRSYQLDAVRSMDTFMSPTSDNLQRKPVLL